MDQYLELFIDEKYPIFIDKYLSTKTLERLKHVTQFCGCDYTNLYHPLFFYTRFDHSLVVAHMTWHFTHNKKETIMALLHDIGTPAFAHCIDYVFGDYTKQESSEKKLIDMIKKDKVIQKYLKEDEILLEELEDFSAFPILENKSPKLCTDRFDGVLHTCYIWLHTHNLEEVKEVYDNCIILENEEGQKEIGFQTLKVAEKFVEMVYQYAKELQGNKDKYVMKYISEIVKLAFQKKLITLEDLYEKEENEICTILKQHFPSWQYFKQAFSIIESEIEPKDTFYISLESKKRNTIPLVATKEKALRITEISPKAKKKYKDLANYKSSKYAYVKEIKNI